MKRKSEYDENNGLRRPKVEEENNDVAEQGLYPIPNVHYELFEVKPIQFTLCIDDPDNLILQPQGDVKVSKLFEIAKVFDARILDLSYYGLARGVDLKSVEYSSAPIFHKAIEQQIESGTINTSYDFSNRELSQQWFEEVLATLSLSDEALFTLNLKNCGIDDVKMSLLCDYLKAHDSISKLYLDDNNIGNAGFSCLAQAVKDIHNIEIITLRNNKIDCSALTGDILGCFAVNDSLSHLDLEENKITTEAGKRAHRELQDIIKSDPCSTSSSEEESDDDLPEIPGDASASGNNSSGDLGQKADALNDTMDTLGGHSAIEIEFVE